MSISDMIDAAVRCARCGTQGFGKCDCWVDCTCGLHILRGKECAHPVHQTTWLADGYWIIDSATGRPYKTHTGDLSTIRQRMDNGTLFPSLKAARASVKSAERV